MKQQFFAMRIKYGQQLIVFKNDSDTFTVLIRFVDFLAIWKDAQIVEGDLKGELRMISLIGDGDPKATQKENVFVTDFLKELGYKQDAARFLLRFK